MKSNHKPQKETPDIVSLISKLSLEEMEMVHDFVRLYKLLQMMTEEQKRKFLLLLLNTARKTKMTQTNRNQIDN